MRKKKVDSLIKTIDGRLVGFVYHMYVCLICRNLGVEYLDLYLIHYPMSVKPGIITLTCDKKDILPMDFKNVWEAMEECQKLRLTKNIGVSNFSCEKLELILSSAKIPPAVNQVSILISIILQMHNIVYAVKAIYDD